MTPRARILSAPEMRDVMAKVYAEVCLKHGFCTRADLAAHGFDRTRVDAWWPLIQRAGEFYLPAARARFGRETPNPAPEAP